MKGRRVRRVTATGAASAHFGHDAANLGASFGGRLRRADDEFAVSHFHEASLIFSVLRLLDFGGAGGRRVRIGDETHADDDETEESDRKGSKKFCVSHASITYEKDAVTHPE